MINLLPPDLKQAMRFGRMNRLLIRWISACGAAVLALLVIVYGGFLYIQLVEKDTLLRKQALEERIQNEKLNIATREYTALSNSTKTVLQLFQRQVLFSKLIQKIATVLPAGVSLKDINLSEKDTALTLNFTLPSKESSIVLQSNLQNPENELFVKADLISTSCSAQISGAVQCGAQIRVLLSDTSEYLLYSPKAKSEVKK
jgi:Tfp pilus assembly protein PilN